MAADADLAHAAYRLMEVLVFAGGIPLCMIALISGTALVIGTNLLRHYWIIAKLLLLVGVILLGMFLFQPWRWPRRSRRVCRRADYSGARSSSWGHSCSC